MVPSEVITKRFLSTNTQSDANQDTKKRSGIPKRTSRHPTSDQTAPLSTQESASASIARQVQRPVVHIITQHERTPSPLSDGLRHDGYTKETWNAQHPASRAFPRTSTPGLTETSTISSSERSRLRRKPSVIGQKYSRDMASASHLDESLDYTHGSSDNPFDGTVLGITLPTVQRSIPTQVQVDVKRAKEQRTMRKPLAADMQKAIQASQLRPLSDTPSTRYTNSPFSQLSTPTSMSSYSPNVENKYRLSSASTGRKGPSLPSSPKAFLRHSRDMDSAEGSIAFGKIDERRASIRPPELAHLNVEYNAIPDNNNHPRRPSRDNTPDLSELQKPFPIIQSDLPSYYATYQKRAPSYEAHISASPRQSTPSRGLFGFRSRSRSREPVPRADSVVASSPVPYDPLRSPVSFSSRDSTPLPGGAVASPSSMFGRLLKNDTTSTAKSSKPAKSLRKGPAAGTGHERYGRFGLRGRTSSISDASDTKRSESTDSVKSKSSWFWRSRSSSRDREDDSTLGDIRNAKTSSTSNEVEQLRFYGHGSGSLATVMSNPLAALVQSQRRSIHRRESLADIDGFYHAGLLSADTNLPRIENRQRRLHTAQTTGNLAVQAKINTKSTQSTIRPSSKPLRPRTPPPRGKSESTTVPKRSGFTDLSEGKEGDWLKPRSPSVRSGPVLNFRQRAKATESDTQHSVADGERETDDVMSTIGPLSIPTEEIQTKPQGLRNIIIGESSSSRKTTKPEASGKLRSDLVGYEDRHSSMLPLPKHAYEGEAERNVLSIRNSTVRTDSDDRPQVLKARAAQATSTAHLIDIPKSPRSLTSQSKAVSAPIPKTSHVLQDAPVSPKHVQSRSGVKQGTTVKDGHSEATLPAYRINGSSEFLAFTARKNSELSYTSSSEAASLRAESTPLTQAPTPFWLGDEDVWDEYNDLMDEVMVDKSTPTARSTEPTLAKKPQLGALDQYDATRNAQAVHRKPSLIQIPAVIQELPTPLDPEAPNSPEGSYRLSRFLQPVAEPSTPYSISDIMAGYSDRTMSAYSSKMQHSLPPTNRQSSESGYSFRHSRHFGSDRGVVSNFDNDFTSNVPLNRGGAPSDRMLEGLKQSQAIRKGADVDLRYGALMTSKWLSFGRVLFSPAHQEVKTGQDCRVLVVDGLGKDWSYYCAETYRNATFYNLDIKRHGSTNSSRTPGRPNHRNVRHSSLAASFPFPGGFFNTVIFRFPLVASEKVYQTAVSECKRVLRAGGYLEISVLDMDMMNMGPKVRRALRRLKTETNASDPSTSLSNLGDMMMKLVGRRGFDNIQRCIVGLPAAGRIPRSTDYSSSSEERSNLKAAITAHENRKVRGASDHGNFFNLLHEAQTNTKTSTKDEDDGIAKMVAVVGRWWYSTCYEALTNGINPSAPRTSNNNSDGTLQSHSTSIWNQPGILRECEKQGTSFKLLLCYGQKPTCPRRRTMSV